MHYITAVPDGPPLSVTITATTVSTITVTWSLPDLTLQNGRIISYKLLYTTDPSQNDDQSQSVTINATSPLTHQLTNLLVNTRYYIKIAAATSIGSGPYSSTITALTQKIIPPVSVLPSSSTNPTAVHFSQSVIPAILIVATIVGVVIVAILTIVILVVVIM